MANVVIMPRQGQSVETCVITEWRKKVGDTVAIGDILFSYETDKSSFDEDAKVEGTLLAVLAQDGDEVPCLEPVCLIGAAGEDVTAQLASLKKADEKAPEAEAKPEAKEEKKEDAPVAAAAPAAAAKTAEGRLRISPRARALAARTDADVSKAEGTGPMGRIIERDINALLDRGLTLSAAAPAAEEAKEAPAAAQTAPAADYEDVKIPGVRKAIAKNMTASLTELAQLTLNASFDCGKLQQLRASLKASGEAMGLPNITLNDMVCFAVAKTILAHRDCNAHYLADKDVIRYFNNVNLGIAVDTPRGLYVPTVFGAEKLTLAGFAAESKKLAKATQEGTISPSLLKGASITVSNLGAMGIESFTPVINPPQTCILGVCGITRRVKLVDGEDKFYNAMGLSLTFDHRALDGAPAAKFLKDLCTNLENFDLLLTK